MRLVTQKGDNGEEGCGAACVAMIASVSYNEARSRLPPHCDTRGTTAEELRAAIRSFGIETEERRRTQGEKYRSLDFDAVLRGDLDGDPHWVVWEAKRARVLDPYKLGGTFECTSYVKVNR